MLWLAILSSAWALRCSSTDYFPDLDAGEVPRNVRWLPIPASGGPHRLVDDEIGSPPETSVRAPDRTTGLERSTQVSVHELGIFHLRGRPLAPTTPFRVLMSAWDGTPLTKALFHTSDRVDQTRPVGGRLLGAVWGDKTGLVLVTERVSDDTRLLAIVESWSSGAPNDTQRSIAWTGGSSEDPTFRTIEADLGKRATRAVVEATGQAPIRLLLEEDVLRCAGPPSGFRRASAGPGEALLVRTRWMDLAGNATPWSGTVEVSSATIDARGWAAAR